MSEPALDRRSVAAAWSPLSDAMQAWWLANRAAHERNNPMRRDLRHFMPWCARNGIVPAWVTDTTMSSYGEEAKRARAAGKRFPSEGTVRKRWNQAACVVAGWPAVWVAELPDRYARVQLNGGQITSLAREDFHPAFVAEIAAYRASGGFLDPPRETIGRLSHRERMQARMERIEQGGIFPRLTRPLKRLGYTTLYAHERLLLLTATALHLTGEQDVRSIRSMRDILNPKAAAVLVDSIIRRLGDNPEAARYCALNVGWLRRIAARCEMTFTAAELGVWRALELDLAGAADERQPTAKNLGRIRQLDDPAKFSMLVALPDVLMRKLEQGRRLRGAPKPIDARQALLAVAIDLLNTLPVRRGTLACLDLKRNFLNPRGGSPSLFIYPDQEKRGQALEAALTKRSWKLLTLYRRHYRPLLPGADRSDYLFPALTPTGHLAPSAFAARITKLVRRRLGLHMNTHLWRHVMGTKLVERTDDFDHAQRLLGHAPGSTSTQSYVRLGTKLAARKLGDITDEVRPQGIALLRRSEELQGRRAKRQG